MSEKSKLVKIIVYLGIIILLYQGYYYFAVLHTIAISFVFRSYQSTYSQLSKQIDKNNFLEKQHDRLYEKAPDMYISINRVTKKITRCNEKFRSKTGYDVSELVGEEYDAFIFGSDKLVDIKFELRQTGCLENGELIIRRKNGENLYVLVEANIENEEDEAISRLACRDITKSKNIESVQQRLLQIIGSTSDIVSTATPDGKVMYINHAGRKILGWEGDLSQKKISDAHPKHVLQHMKKEILPVAIERGIWRGENLMSTKDGEELPVSQILMSHKSTNGQLEYLSTIMRDTTQQKNIEIQLKKAIVAAEMANKAKSEFLANMSHEIRTPMNAILGFTVILSELITDEKQKEYLQSIQTSGKSLLSLINDILDLSKVEAGKLKLEYTTVDIRQLCNEMKQIFITKIENKGLNFYIDIDENISDGFILDEVRLRQVLVNIIGNAVKFTDKGYIKILVKVTALKEEYVSCTIAVEDTGIGVPQEQKEIIFNAFEQQQGQSHAVFGGTGLGLAITKRLVEMMEGNIYIEDNITHGSRFIIHLPSVKMAPLSSLEEKIQLDISQISFHAAVILIADDIDINRDLVKLFLGNYDFTFIEAKNGEEAINMTKEHLPDLVFMDIKMPVINGYEATRQLKIFETTKTIPIVALTASAMKQDEEQLKKICDGFLSKPVAKNRLIEEMTKFLPHTMDSGIVQLVSTENKSNDNKHNFGELDIQTILNILSQKKQQCVELIETLDINGIEQFGCEMEVLGSEHNYQPLILWGKDLQNQASMFDLENLMQTLKKYETIIQELEG
ncbi:ATP-binding protein [Candidatus Uabimicrobium sp. HlEnr_7]|uniref:PAS domain-containing hybrid sensor histidine kinase/response regulator n=1 Tax=Candidatus Uabimicrobium helgolandensis TaxID=3095367 RepID=UPI003557AA30